MIIGRDELGQRSETVRRANLSAIVRELHVHGAAVALGPGRPDRAHPQRDPQPHRGARRRRPRLRGAARSRSGPRVGRRRSCARSRTGRSSWPSRSRSTPWPPPSSGWAARSSSGSGSTSRAVTRRSTRSSADLVALATAGPRPTPGRRPADRGRRGGGGRRPARRTALVSMAPNLGWHDVPARASGSAAALGPGVPIVDRQRGRPRARSPSTAGAPPSATDDVLYPVRRGRRRRRPDRRRSAVHRVPPATAARSATCRSTRSARPVAAGRSAAGRPRSARSVLLELAGHPRSGGRGEVDAVLREAGGRLAGGPGRARPRRSLARASGWPAW